MTTLNPELIAALEDGIVYAREWALTLPAQPLGVVPRESQERIVRMQIDRMKRLIAALSGSMVTDPEWPTPDAKYHGEWLRQIIVSLRGNADMAAVTDRQHFEQIFNLLAQSRPEMVSADRASLLAMLETYVDDPDAFAQTAIIGMARRLIKHLNNEPAT